MKPSAWLLSVSCVCSLSFVACNPGGGGGGTGGGTGQTSCPAPTGTGTDHAAAPTSDETWTAAGSPHRITSSLNIYNDVTVTIEPCAVVQLGEGAHLAFGDSTAAAHLVARGTFTTPIRFEPLTAGTHWASLSFSQKATGDLAYVTLTGGAAASSSLNYPAALMIQGDDNQRAPLRQVKVENFTITDSENQGIELIAAGGFASGSHDVVVGGSGSFGVRGEPLSIQTLPEPGLYGGTNGEGGVIQVAIRGSVQGDLHLKNYGGAPYVLEDTLQLLAPDSTVITFTLDPGVTVKVPAGKGFLLNDTGAANAGSVKVLAVGTAAQPVTLTSAAASPAPGDWVFFDWESGTSDSALDHVIFEYGGGDNGHNGFGCGNGEDWGLLMIHEWVPTAGLVQNSTFRHSAGGGIVSGWSAAGQLPDLTANNTFEDYNQASFCAVSKPQDNAFCATTNTPGQCYR